MRSRFWLPVLSAVGLALIGFSAARAGSFFGPSCYGSNYAYDYPNRAHNFFGCGPGAPCSARHPLFKHRWFRKNQNAMMGGMPMEGAPINGVPGPYMPAPVVQSPLNAVPFQVTSGIPAPVSAMPAVSSRIEPMPAPLPVGPASPEPPLVDSSGKPPF
jgi:hypothetical protein